MDENNALYAHANQIFLPFSPNREDINEFLSHFKQPICGKDLSITLLYIHIEISGYTYLQ